MGHVYARIELINGYDLEEARRYRIGEEEVKRMQVNFMIDTGAAMLCINENIQEYLQLREELIVNPEHPDMAYCNLKKNDSRKILCSN